MPSRVPILVLALLLPLLLAAPARANDEAPDLTTVDGVKSALAAKDASVRLAAARAAKDMPDKKLTTPLLKLLKDEEVPIQEAAMDALLGHEDRKERKTIAKGIALLLKPLTREPSAEDMAREKLLVPALHELAQTVSIKKLLDMHAMAPGEYVRDRLMAVANVPSPLAIEALIAYGSRGRRGSNARGHTARALQYATGLKIGNDPDKWRDWWRENKDTFDFEAAYAARRGKEQEQEEKKRRREEARRRKEEKRRGRGKPDEEDDGE